MTLPTWSLLTEYTALLMLVLLIIFFYDKQLDARGRTHLRQRRLFWRCLLFSAFSTILNLVTVWAIENPTAIPLPANIALNCLYYYTSLLVPILMCDYLFDRAFEYVYEKKYLRFLRYTLLFMAIICAFLMLANATTGIIFYFDSSLDYQHGPLNHIVYSVPVIEIVMLLIMTAVAGKKINPQIVRAIRYIALFIAVEIILQLMFPDELMNGTMCFTACLIMYLCFQNSQIEQDSLTSISNRQSFSFELQMVTRAKQHCQIILVSLRHFSIVNNYLGTEGGDAILIQIAEALKKSVKDDGRVFRYGNVDFAIVMPADNEMQQNNFLREVKRCMSQKFTFDKAEAPISYTIVEFRYHGEDLSAEQIIRYLDFTKLVAKSENKEVVQFDKNLIARYERNDWVLHQIRLALREDRINVAFQPILHTCTGHFESAEALTRIDDEDGNPIPAEEFITVAENSGLIDDISWEVLKKVCQFLHDNEIPQLQAVTINLTMPQLMDPNVKSILIGTLKEYNVAPERLHLEVTERALAESNETVLETMLELNEAGFSFYLDDFGTGYSNFSALLTFPFAAIKLDKSIISGLGEDSKSQITADTLIPFFHELGHYVVAEGVEDETQAEQANLLGADFIQGFHYARPIKACDLKAWYKEFDV